MNRHKNIYIRRLNTGHNCYAKQDISRSDPMSISQVTNLIYLTILLSFNQQQHQQMARENKYGLNFPHKHTHTVRSRVLLYCLQVAVYTRQELNIRITANFLLALAAHLPITKPHVRRYYCAAVQLPSDWLEVARLYSTVNTL